MILVQGKGLSVSFMSGVSGLQLDLCAGKGAFSVIIVQGNGPLV